jgi:hypothetical protein
MEPIKHQKSQSIMIYEDPVTQTKPEGHAVLLRKLSEDEYFERWIVRFESAGNEEPNVERRISKYSKMVYAS